MRKSLLLILLSSLVLGCSGSEKPPVWDVQKSIKKRGFVTYAQWGTALLQNPPGFGVKLRGYEKARIQHDESCQCLVWSAPSNIADETARLYQTTVNFLETRYELVPSPGKSAAAAPTLLLTVEKEGDHGRMSLRAMIENQELGRFEAKVNANLLFDWKSFEADTKSWGRPGSWDQIKSGISEVFHASPTRSPVFQAVNDFLKDLSKPAIE